MTCTLYLRSRRYSRTRLPEGASKVMWWQIQRATQTLYSYLFSKRSERKWELFIKEEVHHKPPSDRPFIYVSYTTEMSFSVLFCRYAMGQSIFRAILTGWLRMKSYLRWFDAVPLYLDTIELGLKNSMRYFECRIPTRNKSGNLPSCYSITIKNHFWWKL